VTYRRTTHSGQRSRKRREILSGSPHILSPEDSAEAFMGFVTRIHHKDTTETLTFTSGFSEEPPRTEIQLAHAVTDEVDIGHLCQKTP
jgi:hypothetical protein